MKNPNPTYTNTNHLSQEQLLRYQAEEMGGAEMQQVERHLLSCPLCSDALEGISVLQAQQARAAMADVKSRLAQRLEESKAEPAAAPYWQWAAAAAILLLTAVGVFLLLDRIEASDRPLAKQETSETDIAAPVHRSKAEQAPPDSWTPNNTDQLEKSPGMDANVEQKASEHESDLLALEQDNWLHEENFDAAPQAPRQPEIIEVPDEEEIEEMDIMYDAPLADQSEAKPELKERETEAVSKALSGRAAGVVVHEKAKTAVKTVTGKVTDAVTGEPLPGVAVRIKGSTKGTVTDMNGTYSLVLPDPEAVLSFNFVGYREQTVAVADKTAQVMAALQQDVETLSEVVVIGRGSQARRDVTGAVVSVAAEPTTLPKPAAGMRKFRKYISQNLRYPAAALEAGIEAEVLVEFYVAPDGSLDRLQVLESPGYGLGEEAIRLLKEGPAWLPATREGTPMRYKTSVKIPFKLK